LGPLLVIVIDVEICAISQALSLCLFGPKTAQPSVGQKLFGPQKLKSENFMADKKKKPEKKGRKRRHIG